jgi:16S rRNA (guanine1207-N2)-methyltransferase
MPRIHKTHHFLLSDESPKDVRLDLVYRPEPQTVWPATSLVVDYDLSRLHKLHPHNWKCAELEDLVGPYERVLIQVSRFDSLQQVKRDVYAASRILSADGGLRVAVPPKSGAKRIASDLKEVFVRVEAVKTAGYTLLMCNEPIPRQFPEDPAYVEYYDAASECSLSFLVRPGIFSAERIDVGTELLLKTVQPVNEKTVLDVGCGYGAIGAIVAARGGYASLLDVDARAVKLAERNLSLNGLSGKVFIKLQPYEFEAGMFDVVLSNPPTHAGSETLRELFSEMIRVSRADGYVAVVVREHLNYEKWLQELGAVQRLETAHGYKILRITKAGK